VGVAFDCRLHAATYDGTQTSLERRLSLSKPASGTQLGFDRLNRREVASGCRLNRREVAYAGT
jgi:hypothetical protein